MPLPSPSCPPTFRAPSRVKFPTVFHGIDLGNVDPGKVVDVERCHIATDGINAALPPAREAARQRVSEAFSSGQGKRVGKRGATLLFRETTEEGTVTDHNADVSERVNGIVFSFKVGDCRLWLCSGGGTGAVRRYNCWSVLEPLFTPSMYMPRLAKLLVVM